MFRKTNFTEKPSSIFLHKITAKVGGREGMGEFGEGKAYNKNKLNEKNINKNIT